MNITDFAYAQRRTFAGLRAQFRPLPNLCCRPDLFESTNIFFSLGAAVSELLIHLCGYVCVDHVHADPYFMTFMCEHRRVWRVQYELPLFGARVIKSASDGSV